MEIEMEINMINTMSNITLLQFKEKFGREPQREITFDVNLPWYGWRYKPSVHDWGYKPSVGEEIKDENILLNAEEDKFAVVWNQGYAGASVIDKEGMNHLVSLWQKEPWLTEYKELDKDCKIEVANKPATDLDGLYEDYRAPMKIYLQRSDRRLAEMMLQLQLQLSDTNWRVVWFDMDERDHAAITMTHTPWREHPYGHRPSVIESYLSTITEESVKHLTLEDAHATLLALKSWLPELAKLKHGQVKISAVLI
jgi:hypothetical protein